jgi:uncharacterized protein
MTDINRLAPTDTNVDPASSSSTEATPKSRRGFASLDPAQVRELARKGGIAAHRAGTAHEFNHEEAQAAGRKGGLARGPRTKSAT